MTAVSPSQTSRKLLRFLRVVLLALLLLAFYVILRVGPLGLARHLVLA